MNSDNRIQSLKEVRRKRSVSILLGQVYIMNKRTKIMNRKEYNKRYSKVINEARKRDKERYSSVYKEFNIDSPIISEIKRAKKNKKVNLYGF